MFARSLHALATMELSQEVVPLVICVKCVAGSLPCPANCIGSENKTVPTCNINTRICSEGCVAGYYGDICDRKCDTNCEREICQRRDGFCKCLSGYTFNTNSCEYITGVKCVFNDQCLNNMCLSASRDDCLEGCKPGRFGKFCKRRCSSHCFCEQKSGICAGCEEGWFGGKCGSTRNPGCVNKRCDRIGTCVDGCTTGMYGKTCDMNCSSRCVSGCDQLSGECAQCEAGWYGSTCQSECSAGCAGTYKDCDKVGTCIRGCVTGYYGEKCEHKCPEGCYGGNCDLKGNCNTCKPGLYGSLCLQSCEKFSDGVCDVITGTCTQGCQIGLYGEMCTKTCGKCTDKVCDSSTGECSKGCQSGYYGLVCDKVCFDCKSADCDRKTGECKGTWMPYIIGGGVLLGIGVLAAFLACCLRRMHIIVKDGVDSVAQKTAVQFVTSHGMTSVEEGNIKYNACESDSHDTYNHLFDIKPPVELTFSLATDDLETSSGYCAVRPLFRGLSCQLTDENDGGSCVGSGGESDTCNSCISVCEGNGSEQHEIKIDEATSTVERERFNISVSKEEERIQALAEIMVLTSDEKGTCGSVQKDKGDEPTEKRETDGCPDFDVGKQRTGRGDPAATEGNSILDTNEG